MKQQETAKDTLDTMNDAAASPVEKAPTPAAGIAQDVGERAGKWAVLAIVAIGIFMATLDSSIVNISLPAIAHAFGVGLTGAVEWVIIMYLVVIAAFLLTIGRLADMIGHKTIWAGGLA